MKKILTALFIIFGCSAFANEMTEDYFDMATNYCVQGNYREALNYLDKILLIEPNNRNVHDLRNGLRQIVQGNTSSYILSKSSAVRNSVEAKRKGDNQGELNALAASNDYWGYYFLAEYYKENKDYNNAITYYIKTVNLKPALIQCYTEIAICYFELGKYSQAITYLNQYIKANPQDDFAYYLKARCEANNGNNETALNDIITALAIEKTPDYKFMQAKILYSMRRYQQALELLKPLTSDIQTAEIYKYIGLSQAELGLKADAIINLEKSIILSDDDRTVNMKYNELKTGISNEKIY